MFLSSIHSDYKLFINHSYIFYNFLILFAQILYVIVAQTRMCFSLQLRIQKAAAIKATASVLFIIFILFMKGNIFHFLELCN